MNSTSNTKSYTYPTRSAKVPTCNKSHESSCVVPGAEIHDVFQSRTLLQLSACNKIAPAVFVLQSGGRRALKSVSEKWPDTALIGNYCTAPVQHTHRKQKDYSLDRCLLI